MGIAESVRAVMWARRRQPDQVAYGMALGHERFSPRELLDQAVEAERAGFDLVCCSDHLAPWWDPAEGPPAHCANAWVWLGAAGQATSEVSLGPAVSAIVHRYNPVVMAQQAATLELMNPGRAFLGVGSGEAMNEVPAGLRWPPPAEQLARAEEALTIITGCSTARRLPSRAGTSVPGAPGCTTGRNGGCRCTCRRSARRRPRSPAGSLTACGRWPIR